MAGRPARQTYSYSVPSPHRLFKNSSTGGTIGRHWDKKTWDFCSIKFTSNIGFYSPNMIFLDFRFLQQHLKVGTGLGFVYIVSLFTFESSTFFFLSWHFLFIIYYHSDYLFVAILVKKYLEQWQHILPFLPVFKSTVTVTL